MIPGRIEAPSSCWMSWVRQWYQTQTTLGSKWFQLQRAKFCLFRHKGKKKVNTYSEFIRQTQAFEEQLNIEGYEDRFWGRVQRGQQERYSLYAIDNNVNSFERHCLSWAWKRLTYDDSITHEPAGLNGEHPVRNRFRLLSSVLAPEALIPAFVLVLWISFWN